MDTDFIVLHDRHSSFYAPVTPSERDQRQRKQIIIKKTDTTTTRPYSLKKKRQGMREQKTKAQLKKRTR